MRKKQNTLPLVAQWTLKTSVLASLMTGFALLSLRFAIPLSNRLLSRYQVSDDWCIFALPAGALFGLLFGLRFGERRWLGPLAGFVLIFVSLAVWELATPIEAPESMPRGMNRLPIGLGNAIRRSILDHVLITAASCMVISAFAVFLRVLLLRIRTNRSSQH